MKTESTKKPNERAILATVITESTPFADDPLAELAELAESAGATVIGRVTQKRRTLNPATAVGKGKIEEIRMMADALDADLVIFDFDLSPSQIREIEKNVERRVIDRSELILDIFAARARTHEARLQVELAQLEYTAPRLRGMWTHLERIAGAGGGTGAGSVGAIGTRGPGERQIEIDRRLVGTRVSFLKDQIAKIDRRKIREVKARGDHFNVSMVGYTNAGKSTLLGKLTGTPAKARDRLFETLDTLTRKWDLGGGRHVLLSDTVGFIRDLPPHLVASFRATLEEAIHADLLLHVADASNPQLLEQIAAVEDVLQQLGLDETPTIIVANKIDAVADESILPLLRDRYEDVVEVSAKNGTGLEELTSRVAEQTQRDIRELTLSIAAADGKALQFVERYADVQDTTYDDGRAIITLRIPDRALEHLHTIAADVRHLDDGDDDFHG